MKTKKILSLLLTVAMVVSIVATLSITVGAIATDATPVYVGETYDRVEFVSSVTTFSAEEQDGNLWYFYTTDETKLKVVNCYIEEDAVEGDKLHVFLKGIAVGNGLEILCKQYDAESTSWVDGVSAINGIYNVVPAPVYLDLDSTTTDILDNKDLDQNYNLAVNEGTKTDVTKVKLTWEIKDINATRTDNKVWDTENLCWKTDSSSTTINQQGTAKFTLENYSSVKVDATVSFKAEGDFKGTVSYDVEDGKVTIDTANGNDTYSKENVPTAVINATVTTDDDDFNDKNATTTATKYGTYTVTIGKAKETVTMTFTRTSSSTSLSYNGKSYDMGESFSFKVTKNSVVSIVSTGVVGVGPTQSTLTVDGKTVTQYSETGSITAWTNISNGAVVTEDMNIGTFSCILSGSKVTLADGSTKLIDDVTTEDKLMTFNFYEGKLDGNYPMYVMKHEDVLANVIMVTLDNGTVLEMCDWQQFFDMDKKSYFDIDAVNYKEAVGRDIMFVDNGVVTTAKVVNATMETRICTSYEIFTEYNKNFVANGILTVEPETYLPGVYTIGDDLKINMEQYQKDVDTYGRYTYEEFADIMTRDEFEKMNIADKKIAVGKGTVSEEWLFALYNLWMSIYR